MCEGDVGKASYVNGGGCGAEMYFGVVGLAGHDDAAYV